MKRNARVQILAMCLLAVAFTGCAPVSNGPNRNPVISSFTLTLVTALTAKLELQVSDPDGDPLKCTIDNGIEVAVLTGEYCSSTAGKPYSLALTFERAGTYTAILKLEDGRGGIAIATTKVTVK